MAGETNPTGPSPMTDTDAGKRLSDAELVFALRTIGDRPIETAEGICAQAADALERLTANRGSVSEERIATIIQNSLGRHLSVDDDKEINGTGPASYEAARTIHQAVSECSGGGAEEMREAAASIRITTEEFIAWYAKVSFAPTPVNLFRASVKEYQCRIRALPLPPSPVKDECDHPEVSREFVSGIRCGECGKTSLKETPPVKESRDADGIINIDDSVVEAALDVQARYNGGNREQAVEVSIAVVSAFLKSTPHRGGEGK